MNETERRELVAHAWLKVGNEIIIGKKGFDKFVVVGFYT